MRIISGKFKGRKIIFIKTPNTRPLKDSVKESIFNILNHSNSIKVVLNQSNILDLYSGIGSFGLEALSRGANKVTFIEKNPEAFQNLRKNLLNLNLEKKSLVINNDVEKALTLRIKEKFDIFFFDPPFSDKTYISNVKKIKDNYLFKRENLIIVHREKNTNDKLKENINIIFEKNYGRSKIIFGKF